MALRFIVLFVGLVVIQLLALHFPNGFQRIYAPFADLVKPFVKRHSLGALILWANLLGIFVYSTVIALVGALLIGRRLSKSPSDD